MDRIQREFEEFHRANPRVYSEIVSISREYQAKGVRAGIAHVWEVMRWITITDTKTAESLKLNNNFRSRYARLVMEREDDLAGFFKTRALTAMEDGEQASFPFGRGASS